MPGHIPYFVCIIDPTSSGLQGSNHWSQDGHWKQTRFQWRPNTSYERWTNWPSIWSKPRCQSSWTKLGKYSSHVIRGSNKSLLGLLASYIIDAHKWLQGPTRLWRILYVFRWNCFGSQRSGCPFPKTNVGGARSGRDQTRDHRSYSCDERPFEHFWGCLRSSEAVLTQYLKNILLFIIGWPYKRFLRLLLRLFNLHFEWNL